MTDLATALARRDVGDGKRHRVGKLVTYSSATGLASVTVDGETITAPAVAGSYTVGSSVLVSRDSASGVWVLGTVGTPPAAPAAPPPAAPARAVTKVALPLAADTWRAGRWRGIPDLYQGDWTGAGLNYGAAWYGTQLRGLPIDTARPYSAHLTVRRLPGGVYAAQAPTIQLLTTSAKPAGAPTASASALGPAVTIGEAESWQLPTAWLDQLRAGTAGGLGIYVPTAAPYVHLAGPASAGDGMALTVRYTAT